MLKSELENKLMQAAVGVAAPDIGPTSLASRVAKLEKQIETYYEPRARKWLR
jgi:hypothetical protein